MIDRIIAGVMFVTLAFVACTPGESDAAVESVVRTADPYARGFADADFPRMQELAPGVYSYEQLRAAGDEKFTTVSLVVVTDEGVLVADGQGNVEETQRMIDRIAAISDRPISHVVICSDHGDHTAGNSAFPRAAAFYAHPTSEENLEAAAGNPNRPADAPPVILPTEIVSDRTVLTLGGREIHLLFLGRAHTGGDLVVYLPEEKIMFMSETYLNRIFPAMRTAYPSEWVGMLKRAQSMDVDVYVPGHGFVESPEILEEELQTYITAVERVIAEGTRLYSAGVGAEDAVSQADFGDLETWSLRASQGGRALRRVYMELDGELGTN